jgi:hypothetical protein
MGEAPTEALGSPCDENNNPINCGGWVLDPNRFTLQSKAARAVALLD